MIAVDTNILVYASRTDNELYAPAFSALKNLIEGDAPWLLPWQCVHEFVAIVTNPKIYRPPTPPDVAISQAEEWMRSPSVIMAGEPPGYFRHFKKVVADAKVVGAMTHDARVVAVCLAHGVNQILTSDRDFKRFSTIRVMKL